MLTSGPDLGFVSRPLPPAAWQKAASPPYHPLPREARGRAPGGAVSLPAAVKVF